MKFQRKVIFLITFCLSSLHSMDRSLPEKIDDDSRKYAVSFSGTLGRGPVEPRPKSEIQPAPFYIPDEVSDSEGFAQEGNISAAHYYMKPQEPKDYSRAIKMGGSAALAAAVVAGGFAAANYFYKPFEKKEQKHLVKWTDAFIDLGFQLFHDKKPQEIVEAFKPYCVMAKDDPYLLLERTDFMKLLSTSDQRNSFGYVLTLFAERHFITKLSLFLSSDKVAELFEDPNRARLLNPTDYAEYEKVVSDIKALYKKYQLLML